MKSNNVKDVVLLIFKVDFGLRNEKNIFNIFEKGQVLGVNFMKVIVKVLIYKNVYICYSIRIKRFQKKY